MNIIEYLQDRGIPYSTTGRNVSGGWVGIQCPFCGDQSNHLGIHLQSNAVSCFICGKHSLASVIMALDSCHWQPALDIITKYGGGRIQGTADSYYKKLNKIERITLPGEYEMPFQHSVFLLSRGFNPEFVAKKYDLSFCGPVGDYKLRIIIPFLNWTMPFQGRQGAMTFVARDITNNSNIPYKALAGNKSIIPYKQTLYNLINCKDTVIVVEGALDVWRIGDNCCATMGTQFTKAQIRELSRFKRVFIMYDAEPKAQEAAKNLANRLSAHTYVEILTLDQGDPADMSEEDVVHLRKEIFGKIF